MDEMRDAEVAEVAAGVVRWAVTRPDVLAVGLAGSQARGHAGPESDVDLVLLTESPEAYLGTGWVTHALGDAEDVRTAEWGPLLERRFRLPGGLQVECGFAPPTWAAVPVDAGTRRVVADGFVVLNDPSGLLGRLVRAVARES